MVEIHFNSFCSLFIFVFPMIFNKRIKTLFISKALLEMDEDSFSISYLNSEKEYVEKQKIYWDTIQFYQ